MSGHSKWSKVKHQKATTDAAKSQAFTRASRGITVAVREGGGTDPDKNFRLRLAIELARNVNMPKETIERAVERGRGADAATIESVLYEGYAPGGVAVLVFALTDNTSRTGSFVRNTFEHAGGSLAHPGAVQYMFSRKGVIPVLKSGVVMDDLIAAGLLNGADDVYETDDVFEVITGPTNLHLVRDSLTSAGYRTGEPNFFMHPSVIVTSDAFTAQKIHDLIAALESSDDITEVFSNLSVG